MRVSNYAKTLWDTIRIQTLLWELSGDSLKPAGDYLIAGDSIFGGEINTNLFLLNGDSLTYENLPTGGGIIGYVATNNGDGTASWQPIPSGNGAYGRNVGTSGIGVYLDTIGSELQFKNIAVGDNLAISESDSVITIDYDGSSVIVTAGTGLSGGGDLSSSITINLYIPELPELTSLSYLDKGNDFVPIYDNSAAQHKKIKPVYFHPDIFIDDIKEVEAPPFFNFIAGSNITITSDGGGGVIISADATASLPTCAEGEFLAYIGGEWTCVNVCDYICADTIINIINNYNDTVPQKIEPSGDVTINFARLDCLDSVQIFAADFVKKTNNLTNIRITSVPSIGELHYNGVAVLANDVLNVVQGTFENDLYYVADETTGSQHVDPFSFQALYSSNQDYSGTFAVNVSVSECVEESVCFGYLYNWYALDDARELTSSATWYVPSRQDFRDLADYFGAGGNYVVNGVGAVLKKTGILFWESPNSSAIDSVGFGAKGSGSRDATTGVFDGLKENNYMWMSDETSATQGKESFMTSANDDLYLGFLPDKQTGNSIRLVSDATGIPDGTTTTYVGNDGKTYNAIAINELYWTTENLEETQYRNGDAIIFEGVNEGYLTDAEWAAADYGAFCVYNNDWNNACKLPLPTPTDRCFGYLYNWYAITDVRNIANDGWHAVTEAETFTLASYLGGTGVAGGKMKEVGLLFWNSPNTGATNESGLSVRGSGLRNSDGTFSAILNSTQLLTTHNQTATTAKAPVLSYDDDDFITGGTSNKVSGNAVRLIKDATTLSHGETGTYTGNDGKVYQTICIGTQEWLSENLEETKYRNGDYIQGYDGGVYTPIDNATWAGLSTGALCLYNDDLNNACKSVTLTEYCYSGAYPCGDPLHEIAGHEPYTGSITYTDAFGISRTEYYCLEDGDITISSSTTPITVGMVTCTP